MGAELFVVLVAWMLAASALVVVSAWGHSDAF